MTRAPFRIELLDQHDRTEFDCGMPPLNDYLQSRASQDLRRRISMCYVAIENDTDMLAGYYTLSATGIAMTDLPDKTTKRLPRYPTVPAVLVGRLAVDVDFQGRRLGGALLIDALKRTDDAGIAAFAMIVDAKDDDAVAFYEHFGFKRFQDLEQKLFLPIGDGLKRLLQK